MADRAPHDARIRLPSLQLFPPESDSQFLIQEPAPCSTGIDYPQAEAIPLLKLPLVIADGINLEGDLTTIIVFEALSWNDFDARDQYSTPQRDSELFAFTPGTITIIPLGCGDLNGDGIGPDIGDQTYLIGYLFISGPVSACP